MQKLMLTIAFVASLTACKQEAQNTNNNEQKKDTAKKAEQQVEKTTTVAEKKSDANTNTSNTPEPNISLQGSFYAPASKEMMIVDWKDGKISKLLLAPKGSSKFVNAEVVSTEGSMNTMDFKFTFKVNSKVLKGTVGASPFGMGISVEEVGKENSEIFFSEANRKTTTKDGEYGVPMLVREIYWNTKFQNESNKATLAAEDSQEGTAEGQLFMTYQTADGKRENIIAQVNPTTHELTFESKLLGGKIRCQLDAEMRWFLRVSKGNTKIADFYEIDNTGEGN